MKRSNNNSSPATARAPFAQATRLDHVPVVFYEILHLATRGQEDGGTDAVDSCAQIARLIQSVITITQIEPDSLAKLPEITAADAA